MLTTDQAQRMLTSHLAIPYQRTRTVGLFMIVLIVHIGIAWVLSSFITPTHEPTASIKMLESFVINHTTGQAASTPSDQEEAAAEDQPEVVPATPPEDSMPEIQEPLTVPPEPVHQKTKVNQKPQVAQPTQRSASPSPAGSSDISLPITHAQYLNNPHPSYPRQSKRLGEQGTVLLAVEIDVDGSASQVKIHQSSGHPRLDNTALETVIKWRFIAGKKAGVSQKMWVNIPINFVLE